MIGRSKRFMHDGLARGLFEGKKSDGRTLLVVQSLKDYCAKLPKAKGSLNSRTRGFATMRNQRAQQAAAHGG